MPSFNFFLRVVSEIEVQIFSRVSRSERGSKRARRCSSSCSSCSSCSSSSGEDKTFRTWLLDTFVLVLMEVVYGNRVSYFQTKLIKIEKAGGKELIGNEPSCFFWLKFI